MTARAHDHTRHRLGNAGLLALPGAVAAVLLTLTVSAGPTLCPFALITGVACPGCGLTRAAGAFVRGDWANAFAYHPLVLVTAAWLAGAWMSWVSRRFGWRRVFALPPRITNLLLMATAGMFIAVWLVRLVLGTLPPV